MPRGDHDADEQRHQADQVAHALLAALHDRTRQRGVHHRQRPVADRVEPQLAFDDGLRAPHDPAALRRGDQFRLFGSDAAIIEQREVHVELCVGADAGDFRRADAAREHQRARRRAAAIAVQDGVGGDHVRDAIDLHQAQRAFLVEHRAHDGREAPDLGGHRHRWPDADSARRRYRSRTRRSVSRASRAARPGRRSFRRGRPRRSFRTRTSDPASTRTNTCRPSARNRATPFRSRRSWRPAPCA